MFEWIFYPWMLSNTYTLLIIYARIDLTPWYIICLYCLLVVEEVIYQFKLKIGRLNGDLLQSSGIRYEVWYFSVRHLISIAYRYRKGLIFGVKMSIVVPQAIGIYLRNTIHWQITTTHIASITARRKTQCELWVLQPTL